MTETVASASEVAGSGSLGATSPAAPRPVLGTDCTATLTAELAGALAVADAILYEGYLLYPYRRSSIKNRVRWQFGVLAPRCWMDGQPPVEEGVAGSAESWWSQVECLLEGGPEATVAVRARWLQVDGGSPAGEHAAPAEAATDLPLADLLSGTVRLDLGGGLGLLTFRGERMRACSPLYRLTVRIENAVTDVEPALPRAEVLCRSLLSCHVLLAVVGGAFLSAVDPPAWASAANGACRNVRLFPVLAGPDRSARVVLAAPIILPDHPEVAPESPGDLFDATEIDEILTLRTLTLTNEEKAEVRGTDPLAAGLLDRVESMPEEVLARLHGAVRSLRTVRPRTGPDLVVAGVPLAEGSPVRLHPRPRGTDAQDMFLDGRTARVVEVLTDVDGSRFVAVTVDGDPRAAIDGGPGRVRHFAPDELEPVPVPVPASASAPAEPEASAPAEPEASAE